MQKLEPGAVIRATREQTRDHTGATGRRDAQAWCRQVAVPHGRRARAGFMTTAPPGYTRARRATGWLSTQPLGPPPCTQRASRAAAPLRGPDRTGVCSMKRLAEPTSLERPSRRDRIRSRPGLAHAWRGGVFALGLLCMAAGIALAVLQGSTRPPRGAARSVDLVHRVHLGPTALRRRQDQGWRPGRTHHNTRSPPPWLPSADSPQQPSRLLRCATSRSWAASAT
jgi:hypothetical protein